MRSLAFPQLSNQQDSDNTEVRLTMAFNIVLTIVYNFATRRVSADRDTSGTLTRKMANSMLMIPLNRTSRDAQHPIQPLGSIARPQQAYRPQHIHDPSGGFGSLESQNSNRTSSRLQRQIICKWNVKECSRQQMPTAPHGTCGNRLSECSVYFRVNGQESMTIGTTGSSRDNVRIHNSHHQVCVQKLLLTLM